MGATAEVPKRDNIFEEPTDGVGEMESEVEEVIQERKEEASGIPAILQEIMDEEESFLKAAGLDGAPKGADDQLVEVDSYLDALLQKIGDLQEQEAATKEVVKRRKAMIDAWGVDEAMGIGSQRAYLEGQVRNIAETWYPFAKGKKTRALPHGSFGFRKAPDTVEIEDQKLALPWAEANHVEVKITKEVQKTPVKEYIKETGDIPDPKETGIRFHPGRDQFSLSARALEK